MRSFLKHVGTPRAVPWSYLLNAALLFLFRECGCLGDDNIKQVLREILPSSGEESIPNLVQ